MRSRREDFLVVNDDDFFAGVRNIDIDVWGMDGVVGFVGVDFVGSDLINCIFFALRGTSIAVVCVGSSGRLYSDTLSNVYHC
jgi:hypothetical protein